jgi:hypothetical protein
MLLTTLSRQTARKAEETEINMTIKAPFQAKMPKFLILL